MQTAAKAWVSATVTFIAMLVYQISGIEVGPETQGWIVGLIFPLIGAGVNGFLTWLVPNRPKV
jgi:hypothetical protein